MSALQENAKIQGIILAEKVSEELLKKGFTQYKKPAYDISTGKTDYILRTSRWPAILIETGFICNDNDRKILTDIEGNTKIAEGIYNGIKEYIKQSTLSSK